MASPKISFEWKSLLQTFQQLKYRSPISMLSAGILAIAVVLGLVAFRAENATVQITLILAAALVLVAFFGAVVFVIRMLGPYASLSGSQLVSVWKLDVAAKNVPVIPNLPSIADPNPNPTGMIGGPEGDAGRQVE